MARVDFKEESHHRAHNRYPTSAMNLIFRRIRALDLRSYFCRIKSLCLNRESAV